MRTFLWSYDFYSESSIRLSDYLDIYRIKHKESKFRGGKDTVVINWGSSEPPYQVMISNIINHPENVRTCTNKARFFKRLEGLFNHPEWTQNPDVARDWCFEGHTVYCRTKLTGHEGEGIVVAKDRKEVVDARLYTKRVPNDGEYRVHVVGGEAILTQRKVLRRDHQGPQDRTIRNSANGFVFQQHGIVVPDPVVHEAVKAVMAAGLDFGGVDVLWCAHLRKATVIEINTAPGIEGTDVPAYGRALRKLMESKGWN